MADNDPSRRTPPFNLEAEACVLGSMMLDPAVAGEIVQVLDDKSFYNPANQSIYNALVDLFDHNRPIDPVILREALAQRGLLSEAGGAEYLGELMQAVPSAAHGVHYAKIVKDKAIARKLMAVADQILRDCREETEIGEELLDKAEHLIFDIAEKNASADIYHIKDILKQTMEQIDRWHEVEGRLTGLATGFADIDHMTSGLQPGQLAIVAGRPSMGKSSFALNIAEHVGLKLKKPVAIFSIETDNRQIVQNLLCMHTHIDAHKMRNGKLKKEDYAKLSLACGALSEAPIIVDDSSSLTPLELRAKARRLKSQYDIELLILDYVQLMTVPRAESRQLEISEVSRSLKGIAKELKIPVLACAQLSRAAEVFGGKERPRMSSLRESGALEQDADLVMLLYRPEYYAPDDEDLKGKAEVNIAKQRNGPTGTVHLAFLSNHMHFHDLNLSQEEPYPPPGRRASRGEEMHARASEAGAETPF
ncbi:MAG: replicative DNA helicase [Planctomycetota bacterium]